MKKCFILFLSLVSLSLISYPVIGVPTTGTFTPVFTNYAPVHNNHLIWNGQTEKLLNASDVNVSSTSINFTISDANGNLMTWYCYTNASGSWDLVDNETDDNNGTKIITNVSWFQPITNYTLSFNVTDGFLWTNQSFWFITDYSIPQLSNENPENGSIIYLTTCNWSINISDFVPFDWNITCSNNDTINGSSSINDTFYLNMSGLVQCTVYTVWVNVTNGNKTVNNSYIFTVMPTEAPGGGGGWVPPPEEEEIPEEMPSVEEGFRIDIGLLILGFIFFFIIILLWKRRKEKKQKAGG